MQVFSIKLIGYFFFFCSVLNAIEVELDLSAVVQNARPYRLYDVLSVTKANAQELEKLKTISLTNFSQKEIIKNFKINFLDSKIVIKNKGEVSFSNGITENEIIRKISNILVTQNDDSFFKIIVTSFSRILSSEPFDVDISDFNLKNSTYLKKIQSDEYIEKKTISAQWKIFKSVPVTKKWIAQGNRVSEDDVIYEVKDITFLKDKIVTSLNSRFPKLNRQIGAQTILTEDLFVSEDAIKKGDAVRFRIVNGAIEVETAGVADTGGRLGDTIKVKVNNTLLSGVIEAKDTVVIK